MDIEQMEKRLEKQDFYVSIGVFKYKDQKNQGTFLNFNTLDEMLKPKGLSLMDIKGVHFVKFKGTNNKFNMFIEMNDTVDPKKLIFAGKPEVPAPTKEVEDGENRTDQVVQD